MKKRRDDIKQDGGLLQNYLREIGVPEMEPRTSPFDPGYDPVSLEAHLEQSRHLISTLKISMACWQVAAESSTRKKIKSARDRGIPVCTGGGPFEVAATFGKISEYLDLCAELGVNRIEAGEGFTKQNLAPVKLVKMAGGKGLEVQFEVGEKHAGKFSEKDIEALVDQGKEWLDAGAKAIVVEARESAKDVGLFDGKGEFDPGLAECFVKAYGFQYTVFEAPNKPSQFALLNHFGPEVHLSNVRLEELLRVEIYRRGLHSDAFHHENLRPAGPDGFQKKKGKQP